MVIFLDLFEIRNRQLCHIPPIGEILNSHLYV
jgi:hypothetical protein